MKKIITYAVPIIVNMSVTFLILNTNLFNSWTVLLLAILCPVVCYSVGLWVSLRLRS